MRIVFHVLGTRGDVHPMLALALRARDRGHSAVVCASPDFEGDARSLGIEFVGIGGRSADLLAQRNDLGAHVEQLQVQVRGMVQAAAGADLVVGTGMPMAGPTAAETHGCPYRYVAQAPEFVESTDYVTPLFPVKRLPRVGRIAVNGGFNALWTLLYGPPLSRERKRLGLSSRWRDSLTPFRGDPPMILACDRALGEIPEHAAVPAIQTAGIQLDPQDVLSDRVVAFLDEHGPAVYLGFGSMLSDRLDQPLSIAGPLHAATDLPVLLRDCVSSRDEGPPWLLRIGDEPHRDLFPRCALVVHHGGAGTTTTAARSGVPQLIVPHLADQFSWALRVESLGIGARVARRVRDPARLADVAARVLSSKAQAVRAAELAEEVGWPDGAALTLDALLA